MKLLLGLQDKYLVRLARLFGHGILDDRLLVKSSQCPNKIVAKNGLQWRPMGKSKRVKRREKFGKQKAVLDRNKQNGSRANSFFSLSLCRFLLAGFFSSTIYAWQCFFLLTLS